MCNQAERFHCRDGNVFKSWNLETSVIFNRLLTTQPLFSHLYFSSFLFNSASHAIHFSHLLSLPIFFTSHTSFSVFSFVFPFYFSRFSFSVTCNLVPFSLSMPLSFFSSFLLRYFLLPYRIFFSLFFSFIIMASYLPGL